MSVAEIDEGVFEATATIDNGSFGTRTIRFETGRLAQQAAGAVVAYLDDENMLLSATTASKSPKEHFDFFPLTVDVEERMYAAGRIPGSFFRREGRPSTDAILTCRLIDRPLRPSFVAGLRNEIQVVVTILSLDPNDLYDVLAINAASASTQLAGLPFSGPIGGVRVALIDGTWIAFPTVEQLESAVFDMVVAGRIVGEEAVQYDQRRQSFDFDMIQYRLEQSLSPGNEQAIYWGSAAAGQPGSRNYTGVRSPGVDAMIAAMLHARERPEFVDTVRALDRLLISGFYVVPLFYLPQQWVARWSSIAHPSHTSLSGYLPETWWREPKRAMQ